MMRIGLLLGIPRLGGYIFTQVGSCIRSEAAALGVHVTSAFGRTVDEQAAVLHRLADQHLDVIVFKPLVGEHAASSRALDAIRRQGIPVVTLDSVVDHPAVISTVGSDNSGAQAIAATAVIERLAGRGQIVFIGADARSPAGAQRNASFHALLGAHPGIALACEAYIDWVGPASRRTQATELMSDMLSRRVCFDAVVATNDEAALGVVDALVEAGRPLPPISGFDGLPDALLAIHRGSLLATMRQSPQAIARVTLEVAMAIGRGESPLRHILVDTELVTSENVVDIALETLRSVPPLIQDLSEHHEQQRQLQQQVIARQARVLQAVIGVSLAVRQIRDPAQMTRALVELLARQFKLDRAAIYAITIDNGVEGLHLEASSGPSGAADEQASHDPLRPDELLTRALDSRRPQRLNAMAGSTAAPGSLPSICSRLVIPLISSDRNVGLLDFQSRMPAAFDEETRKVFEAIASQIATALVNATLYGETVRVAESELRESRAKAVYAERANYLSKHDVVTGLPNRRLFSERLGQALHQARRYDKSLAVVFIDLDGFKEINDTLGHAAGDEVLKEVSTRITGCLRESDTVARQGGDEFIVLLPELRHQGAPSTVARKIVRAIAEPFRLMEQEIRVTASLGIAIHPQDGLEEKDLIKHADIAMYHAKKEGKNNFQLYAPGLQCRAGDTGAGACDGEP